MRPIHALAVIGLLALLPLGNPGCNKYGEGEPCSHLNDNIDGTSNDCDDGLVCTRAQDLGNCNNSDICCPPAGATNPACVKGAMPCGTAGGSPTTTQSGGGGSTTTTPSGVGGGGTGCAHDPC